MGDNELKSWLAANKLTKIANALAENDIECLQDITETFETKDDVISLAEEMQLKTVLKLKFVKAVVKLNNITEQPNVPSSSQPGANQSHDDEKKQAEGVADSAPKRTKFNLKGVHQVKTLKSLRVGKRHRTVMVIGATGTGKTTLLNSLMNYLWEVKYDDPYRFKLIYEGHKEENQSESVTDDVTAYYLDPPGLDYQLTLIDTPGFGDTRGLEQDKKITKKIKKFFEEKIQEIDAICFVIRAPQARLTPTQKYIFAQVLGIFGNDIADNILILMTFADGKKPPALAALKAGNVPFKSSFKLNNSAFDLPEDDEDDEDEFSQGFWKMGIKSFGKLFKAIDQLKTKSLQLTKQVLTRREELENYIESVQPTIRNGFTVLDKLRQQIIVIQKYGDLINANKDFTYSVNVNKARQIDNHGAFNTTTCLECNYTCHRSCAFSDAADKAGCCAMGRNGYCTCCPQRCHWSIHKNKPYTVEWYTESQTRTTSELKSKYYDATSKKSAEEQIMAGSVAELAKVEEHLNGLIGSVRTCLNELAKIALRPNVLSQDDYIEKLIQSEEAERKPGYQQRIAALNKLKEKQEMLNKLNNAQYNPWAKYQDVQQFIGKNANVKQKVKTHRNKKKKKSGGWFGLW
eukprot:256944_1